ncbi:small heat shock protein, partial [Russula ochroleuca]
SVSFDLPGLRKEDVKIDAHNDVLTVSGETRPTSERSGDGYERGDRASWGSRSRSPKGSRVRISKASMKDGVLNVTFPKSVPEIVITIT